MFRSRVQWIVAISALAAPIGLPTARSDDARPEDVLKARGLKRIGQSYVLAAEAELQKRLYAARVAGQGLSYALRQKGAFEQGVQEQKAMIQELTQRWTFLNEQLQQNLTVIEHNQLAAESNAIGGRLNLLRAQEADSSVKEEIDKELPQRRAAFIQSVLDLRERADSAIREYEMLSKDDSIKNALSALNAKSKTPFKLGPSREFQEKIKQIEKLEKLVLTDQIELRDRGGVFELDVTFNKNETVPMIFDTGASIVTISSALAARIGLKPRANDRTIQMHVADGSVVEARKTTIPLMRVGKFTLTDVDCAIMPPNKRDAPLLLGQSFLSHFTHKVDAGRLILTRIEPDEPPARAAAPSRGRPGAKRSTKAGSGTNASSLKTGNNP